MTNNLLLKDRFAAKELFTMPDRSSKVRIKLASLLAMAAIAVPAAISAEMAAGTAIAAMARDRKSTRLNSSH